MAREWMFMVIAPQRGGVNEFAKWLNTLPKKASAKIRIRLKYLEAVKIWKKYLVTKLSGHKNLYEIRIVCNNIQYRPIGCKGPKEGEFTILVGAIERGGKFEPKKALVIANNRSKLINKKGYIIEYEYD